MFASTLLHNLSKWCIPPSCPPSGHIFLAFATLDTCLFVIVECPAAISMTASVLACCWALSVMLAEASTLLPVFLLRYLPATHHPPIIFLIPLTTSFEKPHNVIFFAISSLSLLLKGESSAIDTIHYEYTPGVLYDDRHSVQTIIILSYILI